MSEQKEKVNGWSFGREASPQEMAKALEGYFNSFSAHSKGEELLKELCQSAHRTLLQSFAGFVVQSVIALANTHWVDGRNEASNRAMRKIEGFLAEQKIDRFPMV